MINLPLRFAAGTVSPKWRRIKLPSRRMRLGSYRYKIKSRCVYLRSRNA